MTCNVQFVSHSLLRPRTLANDTACTFAKRILSKNKIIITKPIQTRPNQSNPIQTAMMTMTSPYFTLLLAATAVACISTSTTEAFSIAASKSTKTSTQLSSTAENSRRNLLLAGVVSFGATLALTSSPKAASASYTAFTQREEDWEKRKKTGDIQVSSARSLRKQLAEIVPENSEGSKIFCPNGMASSVSPMMENKCGEQEAMVSVFGRTEDSVGNSIPGFKGGRFPSAIPGNSGSLSANPNVGGFPKY